MRMLVFVLILGTVSGTLEAEDKEFCWVTDLAMKKFEEASLPAEQDNCLTNQDCTYLSRYSWKQAVGVNRTTRTAYDEMLKNEDYLHLTKLFKSHCPRSEPRIIFPLPDSSECVENKCVAKFKKPKGL